MSGIGAKTPRAETILAVDDTPMNLRLVEGCLQSSGYRVITAGDGPRALELFAAETPDLVLLDIAMPGMDGFETCRRARALAGGMETPIVFLTALDDLTTHRMALEAGADDFLTKPIHNTELIIRARSLIRVKRLFEEIRRVNRQKERLTAFVVHDLNNPLMGILANAELMARDKDLPERARGSVAQILSASEALQRMVASLIDLRRSEDGELKPFLEELEVGPLIDDVMPSAERRAEARRQHLVVEVGDARAVLRADRDQVRRLLENLIDHALKRSTPGSSVRVFTRGAAGALEICVRDEGPALPAEDPEALFENGLGLAFCRAAVAAHGGRIAVERTQPSGCTIVFSLPARAV